MRFIIVIILLLTGKSHLTGQTFTVVLGRPTNSSITANIVFDSDIEFYINYGQNTIFPEKSTDVVTGQANVPNVIELSDLTGNAKYNYQIYYKKPGASLYKVSEVFSFHTQRAKGENFTFTIEADEHLYDKKGHAPLNEICLKNQLIDQPDFMFSLGDTFGDDHTPDETTSEDMKELHEYFLEFLGKVSHSIPFFFCPGNHEGENGYYLKQNNGENIAVYGTKWRKYYYPNPYPNDFYTGNLNKEGYGIDFPENYYAFTWGDALFVVLDVYRHCDLNEKPQKWDWTLGEEQYRWFRRTLEESSAKHKLVFAHHTRGQGRGGIITAKGYEWGGYNNTKYEFDTYRPGWGKPIHQVMNDTGVDIFFQGHDHLFSVEKLDNVIYQEVPMPSDSSYKIGVTDNGDAYTDIILDGSGHLRVNVTPQCLTIDYVRACLPKDTLSGKYKNREILYTYTLGQCTSSITEIKENEINVYPNPASEIINIDLPVGNKNGIQVIRLLDLHGKIIFEKKIVKDQYKHEINTSDFTKGIYFLKIDPVNSNPLYKKIILH